MWSFGAAAGRGGMTGRDGSWEAFCEGMAGAKGDGVLVGTGVFCEWFPCMCWRSEGLEFYIYTMGPELVRIRRATCKLEEISVT